MDFAIERLECYKENQGNFSSNRSIRMWLWVVPREWKTRCELLQNTALNASCLQPVWAWAPKFCTACIQGKEIWWCFNFSSSSNTSFVLLQIIFFFFPPESFSLVFIQWFVLFALPGWDPWEDLPDSLCGCISSGNRCHFWGNNSLVETAPKILSVPLFLNFILLLFAFRGSVLSRMTDITQGREAAGKPWDRSEVQESVLKLFKVVSHPSAISSWLFHQSKTLPCSPIPQPLQEIPAKRVFCLLASSCECSLCRSWSLGCGDSEILAWC